ncbi:MAG TPA: hypothetical protein VN213_11035 [Solirubrobacteraceae bacterium]|nr:hypothetical protein [Solirubrobacteraceae bacterium]
MSEPGGPSARDELLRLVKASPQPELGVESMAQRIGIPLEDAEALVDELVGEGRLRRDGDRLLAVEPAASEAPPDEPIP